MTVMGLDEFAAFDVALDGIGMMIEWEAQDSFELDAPNLVIPRQELSAELTENKLDDLHWHSNRSWHDGAGEKRADVPEVSSDFAFFDSKGVDVSEKGELSLLPETSKIVDNSMTVVKQRLAVADDVLWTPTDSPNLIKVTSLTDSGTLVDHGASGRNVADLESDGKDLYIAVFGDGVQRIQPGDTSGSSWSTPGDVRRLRWAKQTLWGLGQNSAGDRYRLLELASGSGSTEHHLFPTGQKPVQMSELGPLLYIAMASETGTGSIIYAFDGDNAPFVALPMPPGDIVTSMTPFLGAGMLIGARRYISPTESVGVVYAGFPQGSGHLVLLEEEVTILGEPGDGNQYAFAEGVAWSKTVYFPWPHDDVSGLGAYLPENGAFFRHLRGGTSGEVDATAIWRGKRLFTIEGDGIYAEQDTFEASGTLESSSIDVNVDVPKEWITQETGIAEMPQGCAVAHEYSTDDGDNWHGKAEVSRTESSSTEADDLIRTSPSVVSPRIKYRLTLTSNDAQDETPVVRKAGIGGWPSRRPTETDRFIVRAYPEQVERGGQRSDDPGRGWNLLRELLRRRNEGGFYDFQPPWWRSSRDTLKVRFEQVRTVGPWGTTGHEQGGLILVGLKLVI